MMILFLKKQGDITTFKDKPSLSKQIKSKTNSPYGDDLITKMVLLIKEELHHFYQVLELMHERGIAYDYIPASRYAKGMLSHVTTHEPNTLIDKLIIGAFIEARSCERFAKLSPYLDAQLGKFYISLLKSEARHYQDYLSLAEKIAGKSISDRIEYFAHVEAALIMNQDSDFKFHSGTPV